MNRRCTSNTIPIKIEFAEIADIQELRSSSYALHRVEACLQGYCLACRQPKVSGNYLDLVCGKKVFGKVGNGIRAVIYSDEFEDIVPTIAGEGVVTGAADQYIITNSTDKRIVA